ncbi:hypothetical protein GX411_08720 [Candidatus Fermentibacteria bacterium]|nr:hypothetical protein [Candidatus Fermentibacteria bacterium]
MAILALAGGSFGLVHETLDIPVGSYRFVQFCVDQAQAEDTRIQGSLGISPDTLDLELMLFHIDDFNRWAVDEGEVDTLFYIRHSSGGVLVPIEGFGDMVLVMSNRGNYSPASVRADLDLAFTGAGVMYNPLQTALRIVVAMLGLAVLIAVILSAVRVTSRRGRRTVG